MTLNPSRRALVAALAAMPWAVRAQSAWPTRAVRIVVPFAAAGTTDILARALAPELQRVLGQPFVVDNKPGAGGNTGSAEVAKAGGDGYTLLMGTVGTHAINPSLYPKMPYDAVKDFTPISHVVSQPLLIVVNPSVPVKDMRELLAYAKAQKQPLQYTSGGIGSYGHLWWEMFRSRQGLDGQHVPYNGIAPALKDVMGGQVPLLIDAIVPSGAQVKAGTVRGVAIVSAQRAKMLPEVATLTEQGYAGFDAAPFYGVLGPAGMDRAVIDKLHSSLARALANPALRDKFGEMGFDVVGSTPEAYGKLIRDEIERWSQVVRERGIKVD